MSVDDALERKLLDFTADDKCGYEETAEVWFLENALDRLDIPRGHIWSVIGNGHQQLLRHMKK